MLTEVEFNAHLQAIGYFSDLTLIFEYVILIMSMLIIEDPTATM